MAKHSLVFKVTGSNSFAADTGTLSLLSNISWSCSPSRSRVG